MSDLILTAFSPKKTSGKVPYSPYDDDTFVFETFNFKTNVEFFGAQVSHFLLNIPLNIDKSIRSERSATAFKDILVDKITYFIFDFDKVYSEFAKNKIIEYFKEYRVIIGESRSYNGIDNFNLKGVLFVEPMELSVAKSTLLALKQDVIEYGEFDNSVLHRGAYQAPILKNVVLYNNEYGKLVKPIIKDITTFYDKTLLSNISASDIASFTAENSSNIQEFCLAVFSKLGFSVNKENVNGSLSFIHPSEKKSKGGFFWFQDSPFIMHHPNTLRSVNIFETVRNSEEGRKLLGKEIDYENELGLPNLFPYSETHHFNEQFCSVSDKKEIIREFLHKRNGVLSIKSPMGSGKSNIIEDIIERCQNEDKKVIIITNRISVAEDYYDKYKKFDLKLYNKDAYNIGDSLIVQFDSLQRYSMKFFDVIIIDEFMSLMLHARNNLTESNTNIVKLFGTFKKKLIIADAFLTGYEQWLLQKGDNTILLENNYKDDTDLYLYKNKAYFVSQIVQRAKNLKENEKISISCTSLGMINGLRYVLEKFGIDVITLTGETPDITKKVIYDLFKLSTHDKFQVVIYSPTLTVGVSNLNNVVDHFHFDGGMSADVISSIQMIKRSRNAKNIHLYLKEKLNLVKTSYESIKDYYMLSIGKNDDSFMFQMDDYGDLNLSEAGKKALRIDTFANLLAFDYKKAFLYLLKNQFSKDIVEVDGKSEAVIDSIIRELNKNKIDNELQFVDDYFKLTGIDKESIMVSKYSDKRDLVFKKFIEVEEEIDAPFGFREEILENAIKDSNYLKKLRRFELFSMNLEEGDIRRLQAKNISFNRQEELVFMNDLLELKKSGNYIIRSFYTPREVQGKENRLLLKLIKDIGFEKDKHGVLRLPEKISKYSKYIRM